MSRVKLTKRVCDDFFKEVASKLALCGKVVLELMDICRGPPSKKRFEERPVKELLRYNK